MTQEDYYEEYGYRSCYECDKTFTNKKELEEHEKEHLIEEQVFGL